MTPPGASTSQNTLMYLCYGQGRHINETAFSLLTALSHGLPRGEFQIAVYTDAPDRYADLPVTVRPLGKAELTDWMNGRDYIHRRQTMSIIDALTRYGGNVAFVDCDTYFKKSPTLLFDRIGPGRTCFHVMEAPMQISGVSIDGELLHFLSRNEVQGPQGETFSFPKNPKMWNSGVLGLNEVDLPLLEKVPVIIDAIWDRCRVHHLEQFAAAYALDPTQKSESRDVVFHYWADYLRQGFDERLPAILEDLAKLPLEDRARTAFRLRLKPSIDRVLKVQVREIGRKLGLPVPGVLKSA